jgi:hypothetical protein
MTVPAGFNLDEILAAEEARLIGEREAAMEAFRCKPTGVNRKVFTKACGALEGFLKAKLEPGPAVCSFASLPDVLEYLQDESWKISQSSLYEHRDAGKLQADANGGFTLSAVTTYARSHLRKLDGTPGGAVAENLSEQKLRAEISRISSDGRLRELRLRQELGELIAKSQVEVELAERANNLKSYFNAVVRSSAGRIIKIVNGDPQKSAELISWMLGMFAKAFDNYSRPIKGTEDDEG